VVLEGIGVSNWTWSDEPGDGRWNEDEAVRLLKEMGAVVSWFEAEGVRLPAKQRKKYHARIVGAHAAKDMVAYRDAVNGYEMAAREAYRRLPRKGKG
jgi:aspartate oxidase